MAFKGGLNFDNDICPFLTATSDTHESCRPDCALRDMESGQCAIMGINVQLKKLEDCLKAIPDVMCINEADT